MNTYKDILNIIGRRMKGNPETNVILRSIIFDENNGDVAFYIERAKNIKSYLFKVWNIDSNRFVIEVLKINSNKFQFAKYKNSPVSYNNIVEEHHRLDIIPNNMEIIAPVIVYDTTHNIKTDNLSLMTYVSNETNVQNWDYEFKVNNNKYHSIDGSGEIPTQMNIPIQWNVSSSVPSKIDYNLRLRTKQNRFAFNGEIQLNSDEKFQRKIKYYLIWKDQDEIKPDNFGLEMAELINLSITENTKITINSHTDNTGFNRTNRIRSEARANAFSNLLVNDNKEINIYDKEESLFDNKFPENRVYNRCLEITLQKD
jgi:outer membrane protein OmpA-like peptidoglycan-associated protein